MRVLVLGAGQDVGKSCVVVRFGGKTFMFDCGMHLGYSDQRRFPDFSLLSPNGDFNSVIDAVFITHFHLDHVGALPYFTEVCGYTGPIYMTYPTRAIAPLMLEDYHRVLMDRPGSGPLFAKHHIAACMAKVSLLDLQETVKVFEGCEVTAYNAGHVLGAAILHVTVGAESVVYTGDFNTVPDRHLAGASLGRLCPDLLISEATYAASIREGKLARETSLMAQIHETVSSGGKVLIPVFAVGRAQELMLLIGDYWDKTQLKVPIYMSGPMAVRANQYYRLLLNWTSSRVKQGQLGARPTAFAFSKAQQWQPEYINQPGPCVLFATPGMLQGGISLEVFKAWAPNPKNLVLLPSYQVAGTVGRKLMLGQRKGLMIDKTTVDVNCKVHYASVSAHADAKGILQLIQQVSPAAVMLVHGEPDKMAFMQAKVQNSLGISCHMPANQEEVELTSKGLTFVPTAQQLLRRLPMSVQQLQDRWVQQQVHPQQQQQQYLGLGEVSAGSVGAAAAGWLQRGDLQQLVGAAMQLAGLGVRIDSSPAAATTAAGGGDGAVELSASTGPEQQQQQQQQQPLPVSAAARAAQLAPWLELLAAAAQEVQQPEQQQQQQQESADAAAPGAAHQALHMQQQQLLPAAADLSTTVAALSSQLQQQITLESQGTVLDGILVVKHLPPKVPADQPLVQSMQLLPAAAAAEVLGLQQHTVKQTCRILVPQDCWRGHQLGLSQQGGFGSVSAPQQSTEHTCEGVTVTQTEPAAATQETPPDVAAGAALCAAKLVAEVLQSGLPGNLGVEVVMHGTEVQLRSIRFQVVPDGERVGGGAGGVDDVVFVCSWQLRDDALAQQCISLVRLAVPSPAGKS